MACASTTRAKRTLAPDEPPEPEEPVADDLDAPPAAAYNSDDEDLFPDTDEDADEGEEEAPDYDEEADEAAPAFMQDDDPKVREREAAICLFKNELGFNR